MSPLNDGKSELYHVLLLKLEETSSLINELMSQIRENEVSLAEARTELSQIRDNLDNLLSNSHGNKSILTRMALLEADLLSLHEELSDQEEAEKYSKRVRWELVLAVIGGAFGIIAAIVTLRGGK